MDEPVANLDPKARLEFFDTLLNLKKKGKAIFVSSHVLAELDIYFDSATILDGGKIVFSGTKTELYKLFPKDKYICVVSKPKVLMEALDKKFKIPYVYVDSENKIIFNPKTKKQADDVLKFIAIEDMYVYEFIKTKPSLEDVYRKLIIKGSVDTMQK
jgi:ABC-2 type transport system ATP-binding protein